MRIAVYQACTGIDPKANAEDLTGAVEQAARGGAAMLFTPEMSGLLDRDRARSGPLIVEEDQDGVLAAVREAARRERIWVHLGSLALASGQADRRQANRGFVIDSDG